MNRVNPILAAALSPFAPPPVQSGPVVQVPVKKVDIILSSSNSSDPETWVTAIPTDEQLIAAVHTLIERHAVELDDITREQIEGDKA